MENFVIGLTGAFGSGCTFLADKMFAKLLNFKKYALSDILKEEFFKKNGRPHIDRHELQEFGNECRNLYGMDFLAKEIVKKIKEDNSEYSQKIVIDSIRNPKEIEYLRQAYPNFFLLAIFSDYEKRWERVKSTYDNKRDNFDKDEYKDQGIDEPEYGQKISKCFFEADLILSNNEYINSELHNTNQTNMISKIQNYIKAFMDPKASIPTIEESLMAIAYANGRRSK